MKKIVTFLKQIQLSKVLVVFLLGIVLSVTTACNSGNEVGARPDVPPVQMGGQNNPHKAGGDGYTKYKMTTDPTVKEGDRASLGLLAQVPMTVGDKVNQQDGLLYPPGSREPKSARSVDDFTSPKEQQRLKDPRQIPSERQPVVTRSDPNARILEKTGQAFEDASGFLGGTATGRAGKGRGALDREAPNPAADYKER